MRRVARVAMSQVPDSSLTHSEYEQRGHGGPIRVALTSARPLYRRLKKELS